MSSDVIKDLIKELTTFEYKHGPLVFSGAVSSADYNFRFANDQSFKDYAKETGNPNPRDFPASNIDHPVIEMVDQSTDYKNSKEEAMLKYLLWWMEGYADGVKS